MHDVIFANCAITLRLDMERANGDKLLRSLGSQARSTFRYKNIPTLKSWHRSRRRPQ
jgi:hypothetical protein